MKLCISIYVSYRIHTCICIYIYICIHTHLYIAQCLVLYHTILLLSTLTPQGRLARRPKEASTVITKIAIITISSVISVIIVIIVITICFLRGCEVGPQPRPKRIPEWDLAKDIIYPICSCTYVHIYILYLYIWYIDAYTILHCITLYWAPWRYQKLPTASWSLLRLPHSALDFPNTPHSFRKPLDASLLSKSISLRRHSRWGGLCCLFSISAQWKKNWLS